MQQHKDMTRRAFFQGGLGAGVAAAFALGALSGCAACRAVLYPGTRFVRPPVDLAPAQIAAGHAPIVVDGKNTGGGEWAGSATVPFGRHGKASFLWSEDGIYGFLKDGWLPPLNPDEFLCVSLSTVMASREYRHIRLRIAGEMTRDGVSVRLLGVTSGFTRDAAPVPSEFVRFASTTIPSCRGFPWEAEFFLSWKAITPDGRPPQNLWVSVFVVEGRRPYSSLKMPLDGGPKGKR